MFEQDRRCTSSGFILVGMLVIMFPLVLLVGSAVMAMNGKNRSLMATLEQERAFLAAEAGIDQAIYMAGQGTLAMGATVTRQLGDGSSFSAQATDLKTDAIDNDNDGNVDEADEAVLQVIVTGTYKNASRRVVAYLHPVSTVPLLTTAVYQEDAEEIRVEDSALITGEDTNIDGTRGNPSNDVAGLSIAAPGTVADLIASIDPEEVTQITGLGGTPSFSVVSTTIDIAALVQIVQNSADLVLSDDSYEDLQFGDASAGTHHVTYHDGDLKFEGSSRGAGILVVNGELKMEDDFRFDGLIIVLGRIQMEGHRSGSQWTGGSKIYGAIIQGRNEGGSMERLRLEHASEIRYSKP